MQLGLSTYAYAWAIGIPRYPPEQPMDATAFLRRAADLGVSVVQISDNLPLHKMTKAEQEGLLVQAQSLGLQVEVGTRGIAQNHLRVYLELAQRFGSPILRTVVDTADHHPSPEEIVALVHPMMPEFAQAGILLAFENHDRFKAQTLVRIIREIDSAYVGICLDTVNSFGAGEGPEVVVNTLGPYTVNLHVKDFTIRRHRHMLGFEIEGAPAGEGMLNIPWLLDQLRTLDRDSSAILETWPPPEKELMQTIEKEDAWVVSSIAFLRTLIEE